jgi:hypothetical protein
LQSRAEQASRTGGVVQISHDAVWRLTKWCISSNISTWRYKTGHCPIEMIDRLEGLGGKPLQIPTFDGRWLICESVGDDCWQNPGAGRVGTIGGTV